MAGVPRLNRFISKLANNVVFGAGLLSGLIV